MTRTEQYAPPAWAGELEDLLGRAPATTVDLLERLAPTHGQVSAGELEQELRASGAVYETGDGWISVRAVAEGAVLTHVLDVDEVRHGVLLADGDLDLWARLADAGLRLAGGGEVRTRWASGPQPLPAGATVGLVGPHGWLDAFQPGQVLGLRLREGLLHVEVLDNLPSEDITGERCTEVVRHCYGDAARALQAYLQDDEELPWAWLSDAMVSVVVAEPGVLDVPVPPISVVLSAAGLQLDGCFVGMPGVLAPHEVDDIGPAVTSALVFAHSMLHVIDSGHDVDADELRNLLSVLVSPIVAERVADAVELHPLPASAVEALLAAAESDEDRGHALLLAARAAEGDGDWQDAERLLDEAARLVPGCRLVVLDAAQYAAAGGDAARADRLLAQAGAPPDDPMRQALRPLMRPPEGVVSRNRPCPCGSRRKYKACCLRDVVHPLPARAPLVYARLVVHALRPRLFEDAGRFLPVVDPTALWLALDMAVFEDDVVDDYINSRGHLLPDDERRLLELWRDTPLALYEVDDVHGGRSVTLRPLSAGEPVVLRDRALSMSVEPLDLLLARPLFDGSEARLLGIPTPVDRMRRSQLLRVVADGDYDPDELAAFFRPQPPPRLRNRDGEDLVLCEALFEVRDHRAWEILAARLASFEDDDQLVLRGHDVAEGEDLHRGIVTRDGDRWTVTTNSVERFSELADLVLDAAPEAVLVSESTTPAEEVMAGHPQDGPAQEIDLTPDHIARMDEYLHRHERDWVDEEVPALDGITPRAAVAAGGAALAELEALLDDMEWLHRQNGHGMDPGRLRVHLGLPPRVPAR